MNNAANTTGHYSISYKFLKSYGWVPKTITVWTEEQLTAKIAQLTKGVINGTRIITKIEKVA